MRISISNIAWDAKDDLVVAALLKDHGIDAIDVAPGKYFEDFATVSASDIAAVRSWWMDKGIEIIGMQSLLFGTKGLNLFGNPVVRERMLSYLGHVCRIANGLGARCLVFGSPRNRDCAGLSSQDVTDIACDFFQQLGQIAAERGTVICLEPNPPIYNSNFMTDAASTAEIVRAVSHPAVRMQLDVGALTINGESAAEVLSNHAELVAHVHASEPGLKVLGECGTDHGLAAAAIRKYCPAHIVTVEMRKDEVAPIKSIDRAISLAKDWYAH